ncbi:MAG: small multi-drug export protein [Clostridia bacterium]|nr:small multi-drug export protein [Clostridia bacterium]
MNNMGKIAVTALLSMVPMYEGRYAVATGIAMQLPVGFTYLLAFLCSSVPIPIILLLLRPVLDWFYTLPIPPVRKFAAWLERRSAQKREKMERPEGGVMGKLRSRVSRDTFELIALYAFVALPLPGTGVWTGSAIATLFEMPRLKSGVAILLGNATACLIITLLSTGVKTVIG